MQHMQFRAESAKNDLKPTNFLKRNLYFETEGVSSKSVLTAGITLWKPNFVPKYQLSGCVAFVMVALLFQGNILPS